MPRTTREVVFALNTVRTSSSAPHSALALRFSTVPRFFHLALRRCRVLVWIAAALMLAGLTATASLAGLQSFSAGGTGSVLALAAQLRSARAHAEAASSHASSGRTVLPRRLLHSGALVSRAAAAAVVPISGGVQTYDVNNPTPAFRPLIGYGTAAALNNSSTNPPVYINTLAPTNLTPVWSADETFLIFSSNRTQTGGINADATDGSGGSRFHLWAISVNGGEAFQITTSAGPAGGGEFFPALSQNNLAITFTSDAQSAGTQNLFAFSFSYSTLISGTAPANLTLSAANPNPPASLTLRGNTEAASAAMTGFGQVLRPTFSPNDSQLLVFSAVSTNAADANGGAGHAHLYFLYTSSGGFSQGNNVSFPGKLTDGPADDTDPTFAPDGTYIAFASTANANGFTRNSNNAFGPTNPAAVQDPSDSQSLSTGVSAGGLRSVFLISGGASSTGVPFGTVPTMLNTGGRISLGSTAGYDDYGPAWSSFANQNQYTNTQGNFAYLAFARSTAPAANANHDIYFFQAATGVSQPSSEALRLETAAGNGNAAIKLNTDDNAGETTQAAAQSANAGNSFDDVYPTWSPFLSIFSIAYSSNRTVTYNNPTGLVPVEVAASIAPGGASASAAGADTSANYSVGAGYAGLLISQVLNLDPPTLLRFSTNEVVHVQAVKTVNGVSDPVSGTPNKLAATGGQPVVLTVRLSDREAGITNTGGPGGGPRVYVQIKDPDSKYDDSQNAEHKVFAKDPQWNGQANQPLSDVTSGIVNAGIGAGFAGFERNNGVSNLVNKYTYPSYGTPDQTTPAIANRVYPRGAHGGFYFNPDTNNPDPTYIFVGKGAPGTTQSYTSAQGTTPSSTDPNQFIPQGPEYEAQVVNPMFANGNTTADGPNITVAYPAGYTTNANGTQTALTNGSIGDYVSPYWLAGVDDQGAFSGGTWTANTGAAALPKTNYRAITPIGTLATFQYTHTNGTTQTDRPVAGYNTAGTATDGTATTTAHPAEWLQLSRVPDAQQDNQGGVLYTVTWNTPASGSDFYVDVIAYDNAVFPNVPGSAFSGQKTNWRIYDNVGGFSTNSSIGGNDILLVSDYALGQKFAATTFGGRNTNLNLVPKVFGTESYLSAVDVNILPDSVFAGYPTTPTSYYFNPSTQALFNQFFANQTLGGQNGLGVGSYLDNTINDGTTVTDPMTGARSSNVQSQRYSIWRILSRGPVPASLLQSYTPTPVSQPKIADPSDQTFASVPAKTILDAPRCVVWLSPYTGDVLADPGTIDDPGNVGTAGVTNPRQSTTSLLTAFVQAGGRLLVTGQDVGSTLTQGGTVGNMPSTTATPNFLPDVLNATLIANSSGVNVLAATANRITGSPFYDNTSEVGNAEFNTITGPIQGPTFETYPNYPYQDNLVLGDADFNDSSLSQVPAIRLPGGASIQGQSDAIAASNTALVAATYGAGGTGAMVFHDDPYSSANTGVLPNGGTGSRVVYAGFGLEGLSQDYYSSASPNPSTSPAYDQLIPQVFVRNPRSEILHNIVSFLRTGRVSGTITQTAGTGQGAGAGIDGVTVYLHPINGFVPPARAAFSALTANGGRFTISGVEPGTYTLVAIKPGYQRAASNNGVSFTVEGDVSKTGAALTLTPQLPGAIAGTVHDTAGNPINMSTVTFTSQDNSVTVSAVTANGSVTGSTTENYFIQSVPVTSYTATASSPTNPTGQAEYTAAKTPDAPAAGSPTGTPDYSQGVTVQPNTTIQPVNFTLTPILAQIKGTVTSSVGGAGIGGATVAISSSAGQSYGSLTTAADGTYTLPNIPAAQTPTSYVVTVTAPGFAPSAAQTFTVYLGSVITGANFALTPINPGSIAGTVTYAAGGTVTGPVSGAIVTYTAPGGTPQTVTTAADGTYTIPSVPPATYTISAIGPNNANGKPTTTRAPAQTVTVTSNNQSTVPFVVTAIPPTFTGTVMSASTATTAGAPLANVTVSITGMATGSTTAITPVTTRTNSSGVYTSPALAPGTYTLTASLAGYGSKADGPVMVQLGDSGTVENFTLGAVAPGSITGSVLDSNGNPVSKATVTFMSTDGTVTNQTTTTSPDGTYVIPPSGNANVPASTYTGTATGTNSSVTGAPQYGTAPAQTVTVPTGGSATANFTLPVILASVSGTVTDVQAGGNVAGASVTLLNAAGTVIAGPTTTGTDGAYSFTGVLATQAAAPYTVSATAPNYFPGTTAVTLSLGDALTGIGVPLNEQATLYGYVTDGSQNAPTHPALTGVTITVTDSTGAAVATTPATVATGTAFTGPDGHSANYSATLLPGSYTITATKGSYTTQTTAVVTLTNTTPLRQNFALVSSLGTLGGLVTDQNGASLVSGATVTATPTGGSAGLTFTTSTSATNGPDGQPLNYSGQLAAGTYNVTVTKGSRTSAPQPVTVTGGAFVRLDFSGANGLPALHTFPAGIQFVSTPYDYSAIGFNGLFGALNTAPSGAAPNGNRSNVAVWNPLTGAYALDPTAPADTLRLGVGYWVFLKNATAVTQQGAAPAGAYVAVSLGQGWNQIGVPSPSSAGIAVSSLKFDGGPSGMITFTQASSSQYNLVTRPLYGYAGGGYQSLSAGSVLAPWSAYWIYVNAAATLEIPTQ